jgi:fatty-acyl-CoA synthase
VVFIVPGEPGLTAAEILSTCRGRIADYKLPKDVRFIEEAQMPRSVQGKALRHALEAMLQGEAPD